MCGKYVFYGDNIAISPLTEKIYYEYFRVKLGDQDKKFAPHSICRCCHSNLIKWKEGKLKKLQFSIPMIWREQSDHVRGFYFYLTSVKELKMLKNIPI